VKGLIQYQDITVNVSKNALKLEVSGLCRILSLESGAPNTMSLQRGCVEFVDTKNEADFSFIGMNQPGKPETPWQIKNISSKIIPGSLLETEHVQVIIQMHEPISDTIYRRKYILYPGVPAIAVENYIKTAVMPNIFWSHRQGIDNGNNLAGLESCADSIKLTPEYTRFKSIKFYGRTDRTDLLVEEQCNSGDKFNGNIFLANKDNGTGIAWLQEAPPSDERRDYEKYDFRIANRTVYSCSWGLAPEDIKPGEYLSGYRHVLFSFNSHSEYMALLKIYQKKRYPMEWEKHPQIIVNPWGCGKFPELCSQEFLKQEIRAAAKTGATHYQIDDSWQEGKSLLEIAHKNCHVKPEFWRISRNLNRSFALLKEVADKVAIELGLWFAPSFNCEYRDWKQSLEVLMMMHRQYGIRIFKIDGIRIRSYLAEKNLRKLLENARNESNGEISFNLDVTSGQRLGYFYFLEYGNIFLENRYICRQNGLGYHPVRTLRNLWCLSRFVRAQTLQIEIPNPEDINENFYQNSTDPRDYPLEYWVAIAMFANPLMWFAPSRASNKILSKIHKMMKLYKKLHSRIFGGEIFPIGDEPSGSSFTGFQSHDFEINNGLFIIYRELQNENNDFLLEVDYMPNEALPKVIYGNGEVTSTGKDRQFLINMPEKASFILCEY